MSAKAADGRRSAPPRVQQWKNSLLDLTLRNRLINYTDRAGVGLVVPEGRLGTIEDIISAGRPLHLRASDSVDAVQQFRGAMTGSQQARDLLEGQLLEKSALFTDVTAAGYQTRMRGLAYKARTIVDETGANNLYLALGSLHWRIDNKQLRSPLVLVPVRLVAASRGGLYRLELDETGASTPNYCLLEKLRQVDGVEIPLLENPESDDSGIDLDGALAAVRDAIAQEALPYRVEPTADLSILQFAKFRLWKDLDENWETLTTELPGQAPGAHPDGAFVDPVAAPEEVDLDALDAACPVAADASQLAAVADAVNGRTFVLEGPPGHGQVPDHHQPPDARGRRRQAGALRRREAGCARRRAVAARVRGHGRVLPGPARPRQQAGGGARPDPRSHGPRRRRRRAGPGCPLRRPATEPSGTVAVRRAAARDQRSWALLLLRAHPAAHPRAPTAPAFDGSRRAPVSAGDRPGRGARRGGTATDRRGGPGGAVTRPPMGLRESAARPRTAAPSAVSGMPRS